MKSPFMIVNGSVNRDLAMAIAQRMNVGVGKCRVARFPDTEVNVQLDEPVRDSHVFIVQSSCPPVDERAMEAFAIADACRRAAASSITWIAPYFGYARSDKRRGRRTALMGRLVADFDSSARPLGCIEARYGTRIGDCLSGYGRNETGVGVCFPLELPGGGSSQRAIKRKRNNREQSRRRRAR